MGASGTKYKADGANGSKGGGQDAGELEVLEGGAHRGSERALADAVTPQGQALGQTSPHAAAASSKYHARRR